MSRKRLGYILIGVGVVLAFVVGVVVYLQVSQANQVIASLPKQRVIIATANIPQRAEIAASMISLVTMPDEAIPPGAATKVEDVVGKFTPFEILKGEVINTAKIGPVAAKNAPSFLIEKGKVMYAMPLQLRGQEPFSILQINALRPGDRVDFIYTAFTLPEGLSTQEIDSLRNSSIANFLQTRFLLQNVRIQEIGSFDEKGKIVPAVDEKGALNPAAQMVVIVSPEEALVLQWLRDAAAAFGNTIQMVLRAPGDEQKADANLTVNLNYMREKYGLPEPPRVVLQNR